ncbi:hypothetical protein BKA62DRAFT_325676 [Auriculariales sp. MPI-PUGE-AT-0066]|nr:hypothetical protein BKA62DRAFT_325676 [Auriculariales sp. MPI-PUGE-AT-0066]
MWYQAWHYDPSIMMASPPPSRRSSFSYASTAPLYARPYPSHMYAVVPQPVSHYVHAHTSYANHINPVSTGVPRTAVANERAPNRQLPKADDVHSIIKPEFPVKDPPLGWRSDGTMTPACRDLHLHQYPPTHNDRLPSHIPQQPEPPLPPAFIWHPEQTPPAPASSTKGSRKVHFDSSAVSVPVSEPPPGFFAVSATEGHANRHPGYVPVLPRLEPQPPPVSAFVPPSLRGLQPLQFPLPTPISHTPARVDAPMIRPSSAPPNVPATAGCIACHNVGSIHEIRQARDVRPEVLLSLCSYHRGLLPVVIWAPASAI